MVIKIFAFTGYRNCADGPRADDVELVEFHEHAFANV